jgi:hypothetical protein
VGIKVRGTQHGTAHGTYKLNTTAALVLEVMVDLVHPRQPHYSSATHHAHAVVTFYHAT